MAETGTDFGVSAEPSPGAQAANSAWEAYIADGVVSPYVRELIRAAQQRGRDYGVYAARPQQSPDSERLAVLRARGRELLRVAAPFARGLHDFLAGRRHLLMLADAGGVLLHLSAAPDALTPERSADLFEGASWREQDAGCNGVGTALAAGQPVVLIGPDHLMPAYATWTFAGVPLADCRGIPAGVLALAMPNAEFGVETWRVLLAVARAIDAELAAGQRARGGPAAQSLLTADAGPLHALVMAPDECRTRLQSLRAALAAAPAPGQILALVAGDALAGTGLVACALAALTGAGTELTMLAVAGHWPAAGESPALAAGMPMPVVESACTRRPVWLECTGDLVGRYPILAPAQHLDDEGAFVALPLPAGERLAGVLALRFAGVCRLQSAERAYLLAVARACTPAVAASIAGVGKV